MATEYALQHLTSRRYLASDPAALMGHAETTDSEKAFTWPTMTESIIAQDLLEDFGSAWDSVPVARADRSPYPMEREGPRA